MKPWVTREPLKNDCKTTWMGRDHELQAGRSILCIEWAAECSLDRLPLQGGQLPFTMLMSPKSCTGVFLNDTVQHDSEIWNTNCFLKGVLFGTVIWLLRKPSSRTELCLYDLWGEKAEGSVKTLCRKTSIKTRPPRPRDNNANQCAANKILFK